MNCIIYLRVSTKEQAQKGLSEEGYSIPAQREACLKFIKDKGWNLLDEYVDRGESARSAHRPQLQEMLSRIKKDKTINVVVVHKIDRLARNLEDHVAIKAILKRQGVSLVSVVENIEDTASGRLIEGIHALMAEFYSANLGMETKKGMIQKAKQGGWPEMAPIGYKNVQESVAGRLVRTIEVDEERAPYITQAFKLYATGNYSLLELQEMLTRMGLRSRSNVKHPSKPISKSNLSNVLQNKFYTGMVVWDGMETKGVHTPLISKEVFFRVEEVIRIHDQAGERKRKHPHYLRGTVFCGECGSRMSSLLAKNRYLYFYCIGQKRHNGCRQKYIDISDLEKTIEDFYKNIQLPKDWVEKLRRDFETEMLQKESTSIMEQKFLTRKMAQLSDQKYKLLEAYYNNAISIDMLKKEQQRISDEMANFENRLDLITNRLEEFGKVVELALKMAANCYVAYQKASPKTRRMFNQAFFKKLFIKNKKVEKAEYSSLFDLLFSPSLNKEGLVAGVGFEPTTDRL